MLKITKSEFINHDKIECMAVYESVPVKKIAKKAKEIDRFRGFTGKTGYKTIIFMNDGFVYLCPCLPATYASRMNIEEFITADPNRYFLKKDQIREISTKLNNHQRKNIQQAKERGMFINLSKNKSAEYYVFMISGRIYALHNIRNFNNKYVTRQYGGDLSE